MSTPMLDAKTWLVVGDVLNPSKPAHTIVQHLTTRQRTVYPVNPRIKDADLPSLTHTPPPNPPFQHPITNSLLSLSSTSPPIDVLDLCIAPTVGLSIVQQATSQLGVKNVFIQPGAESDDILSYCKQHGVNVHQGCVLREMA